jgi:hypothetical protein
VRQQPAMDGVGEVIAPSELGLAISATWAQVAIMTGIDSHLQRYPSGDYQIAVIRISLNSDKKRGQNQNTWMRWMRKRF